MVRTERKEGSQRAKRSIDVREGRAELGCEGVEWRCKALDGDAEPVADDAHHRWGHGAVLAGAGEVGAIEAGRQNSC